VSDYLAVNQVLHAEEEEEYNDCELDQLFLVHSDIRSVLLQVLASLT
jgi:hypothetical protein